MIKWIFKIIGFVVGFAILALFVWLGVNIGQWAGFI